MVNSGISRSKSGGAELSLPREGRLAKLVPVSDVHLPFLYSLATSERTGFRWGIVGTLLRPDQFAESLWAGIWCQFVVVRRSDDRPLGLVVGYDPNFNDGYAYGAEVLIDEAQVTGVGVEALGLFLNILFSSFNFRKIYFEVLEYNLSRMQGAVGDWLHEEGRLKDHSFFAGEWWDKITLAMYREEFVSRTDRFFGKRDVE